MFRRCVKRLMHCLYPIIQYLNEYYKQWTKPDTDWLVAGTLVDVTPYGSKINLRKKSASQMGHGATGKNPQDTVSKVKSQEPRTQADGRKLDQNHAL
jgi:hypothetical protein